MRRHAAVFLLPLRLNGSAASLAGCAREGHVQAGLLVSARLERLFGGEKAVASLADDQVNAIVDAINLLLGDREFGFAVADYSLSSARNRRSSGNPPP